MRECISLPVALCQLPLSEESNALLWQAILKKRIGPAANVRRPTVPWMLPVSDSKDFLALDDTLDTFSDDSTVVECLRILEHQDQMKLHEHFRGQVVLYERTEAGGVVLAQGIQMISEVLESLPPDRATRTCVIQP
jgi:hypothetical protein